MRISPVVGASSALLLASAVNAFRDTSPLLVWSSTPNDLITEAASEITSGVIAADAVFGSLSSLGCDWDVVMLVHMDELHQSHVEKISLPYSSTKADLHIPYLVRPEREALNDAVTAWADACGAEVVDTYEGPEAGERVLVYSSSKHGEDVVLPRDLPERHIVVLTGTRTLAKRQVEASESAFELESESGSSLANTSTNGTSDNSTSGPLFDRVQILTTPLITALLVSFGILIPLAVFGISALASIQVPPRMLEIGKALAVNKDRKDQ